MKNFIRLLMTIAMLMAPGVSRGDDIITVFAGGSGTTLNGIGDGGPATKAHLSGPGAIAFDPAGNLYIWEVTSGRIRKVDTNGIITTFAGTGAAGYSGDGGPATAAQLNIAAPRGGLATDSQGNLYIADGGNSRIRKVDTNGIITTVAGNGQRGIGNAGDGKAATEVALCNPVGVAVDNTGNLYIGSGACLTVRKVDTSGVIHPFAGSGKGGFSGDGGPATKADMLQPFVVKTDSAGNVYIIDEAIGSRVRKVDTSGTITTIAGNGTKGFSGDGGPATSAQFFEANGVAVDHSGNVFISDSGNGFIRKVDTSGTITTFAGHGADNGPGACPNLFTSGCLATNLKFTGEDVAVDKAGNVYIPNFVKGVVYKVSPSSGPILDRPSIAANGVVNAASFLKGITANSWVTISGTNLAAKTDDWGHSVVNGQLPTSLDGVSVTMSGKPAYVYFISPTQINVLAPDLGQGPVGVIVTTSGGSNNPFITTSIPYNPAFFIWPGNQPVATRQDFTYAVKAGTFAGANTVPAKPGDVIILWGTGFGPTTPKPPVGSVVPSDQAYNTSTMPTVTINSISAKVYGAALAPGAAGLYQVAIQVPSTLPDGDWPIQVTIGGVHSPEGVLLTVHH